MKLLWCLFKSVAEHHDSRSIISSAWASVFVVGKRVAHSISCGIIDFIHRDPQMLWCVTPGCAADVFS